MAGNFGSLPINIANSSAPSAPSSSVNLYSNSGVLTIQTSTASYAGQPFKWSLQNPDISGSAATPSGLFSPVAWWTPPSDLLSAFQTGIPSISNATVTFNYNFQWSVDNNSSPIRAFIGGIDDGNGGARNWCTSFATITCTNAGPFATTQIICPLSELINPLAFTYTRIGVGFSITDGLGTATWTLDGYSSLLEVIIE